MASRVLMIAALLLAAPLHAFRSPLAPRRALAPLRKFAPAKRFVAAVDAPPPPSPLAADVVSQRLVRTTALLVIPSLVVGALTFALFPTICRSMRGFLGVATLSVLSGDQGQFIQNFLAVIGILFSLLIGNTYAFCYNQQVQIYGALFQEVSVAKSLLEQATLVCQGRPSYSSVLDCVQSYVDRDLKRVDLPPAAVLSARPRDDPLEAIMWMTSVGTPSAIYDTVRDLRAARGERLGAMQRKLPPLHFGLLFLLGFLELCSFPLLSAGAAQNFGAGVLVVEGAMFALMSGALMLTLGVVIQLWRPRGSAYSTDAALAIMIKGLEEELNARRKEIDAAGDLPPAKRYPS